MVSFVILTTLGAVAGVICGILTGLEEHGMAPWQKGTHQSTSRQQSSGGHTYEAKPQRKKHSGKCDGDCANCPPHYGYRHGRWYYGHDHIEGCEFGGNKGSGSRD